MVGLAGGEARGAELGMQMYGQLRATAIEWMQNTKNNAGCAAHAAFLVPEEHLP